MSEPTGESLVKLPIKIEGWILFTKGEKPKFKLKHILNHIYRLFTSDGFVHVEVILKYVYVHGPCYVHVNPTLGLLMINPVFPLDDRSIELFDCEHRLKFEIQATEDYIPRGFMHCVSVVKHMLGVSAPLVHTPKQLHNYLINTTQHKILKEK